MEFLDPRATWSRKQVRSLGGPQSPFCLSKMLQIHAAGQKGVPTTLNHCGAPFDRARSHLVQSQSWGERRSRWRQARFSRLVRKPQSSPPAKGFPQLLLRGGSEEMRLTGWEGCSQLRGTASGISIRNWRRPRAAELVEPWLRSVSFCNHQRGASCYAAGPRKARTHHPQEGSRLIWQRWGPSHPVPGKGLGKMLRIHGVGAG